MTYELAEQLKNAGFPQNRCLCGQVPCPICKGGDIENAVHYPDLSELIEACGDDFLELVKAPKEILPTLKMCWNAKPLLIGSYLDCFIFSFIF